MGEKTGQKASAEQVAKDMCNVRTYDNQRRFGREEWLTKLQVQGLFSGLPSSRRKQGKHCNFERSVQGQYTSAEKRFSRNVLYILLMSDSSL